MSQSLENAVWCTDLMIKLLKCKIEAYEKFKNELKTYDRDLTEVERLQLWNLINEPDQRPWSFNSSGNPTFCSGKNEQNKIEECIRMIEKFAKSRIPYYNEI